MSLLASLVRAYDRDEKAPPFGFSSERIGYCIVLNADGSVAEVADLRDTDKRRSPRVLAVPTSPKRSGSIPRPNFLWDNINYALGAGKLVNPGDIRFEAFRDKHLKYLSDVESKEIGAFCRFLRIWNPAEVTQYFSVDDLPTQGLVFSHVDSYRDTLLHQTKAAQEFWDRDRYRWIAIEGKSSTPAVCLVSGEKSSIARTHPPIKGMSGVGGKSEMALVSFNDNAYASYGHEQGDNAPVSEAAAFKYTTALNGFLANKAHRLQIGDASTVFWADAAKEEAAEAENLFAAYFDPASDDRLTVLKIGSRLEAIRTGARLHDIAPDLAHDVRFHVLGLAPNAARLSVRFYWSSDFGTLTANYQRYLIDTEVQPPPRDGWPPLWRYLIELASQGKRENVPPLIAGEWIRSILTGTHYPMTLLSTTLMRIRADGEVNACRAAILKSVLIRNFKSKDTPVALDPANTNKGYMLGRLFAVYEEVQRGALGGNVNATIRDKFYGAASATPQKVFRTLDAGSQNHFSKLRKQSPGRAVNLEKLVISITDLMDPGNDPIPASLNTAEQALFGIGYYHQRSDFFRKREDKTLEESAQ